MGSWTTLRARAVCGLLALLCLAGCSGLPDSGPSAQDITQQAVAKQTQRYEVVEIDSATVDILKRRGFDSLATRFGDKRMSSEPVLGVGDAVTVTIWEAKA